MLIRTDIGAIQLKPTSLLSLVGTSAGSLTLDIFPLWPRVSLGTHLRKYFLIAEGITELCFVSESSGYRPPLLRYQLDINETILERDIKHMLVLKIPKLERNGGEF